jgi:eukaryotic-like serine/threonine-protein kinase
MPCLARKNCEHVLIAGKTMNFIQKIQEQIQAFFKREAKLDIAKRFEIKRDAISGTMSSFHEAREINTGKKLGLKLLDKEKTDEFEKRFRSLKKPSEGQIALGLKHAHIVETYEFGETSTGQQYILMEYVEGLGLNVVLQERKDLIKGKKLILIRQMLEAIEAVHKAGYVHRDICPRNFIVSPDGNSLKLIDFGLTLPATAAYFQPGNRTGTPLYMAPEIVRRRPTDHRVDIFSFGVTAFYMLAGEHPWPAIDTTGKGALSHDTKAPLDLNTLCPNVNRLLSKIIHQCIAPNPADRPANCEGIVRTLKPLKSEEGGNS